MTETIHVCLVSAQPLPNLLPLLDPRVAPRRVILVVTPDMLERAGWLNTILKPRGIHSETWTLEDAWNFEHIQARMAELLDCEAQAAGAKQIVLNATGGTKLMSIAACEAFRARELPVFYIHPLRDELLWLQPEGRPPRALAERIGIEAFLQAHGASVQGKPRRNVPRPQDLETAGAIIDEIQQFGNAVKELNGLALRAAKSAKERGLVVRLKKTGPCLDELITLFSRHGKLRRKGGEIRFPNEQARFFVNGGWIEPWVFAQVQNLRQEDPHIHDLARGVNVVRMLNDKKVHNELDVLFLRNNRLHIIECKTRRFHGDGQDSIGAETLYKLDALRDLMGGLQARAMLVSCLNMGGHDRTRAADLGIAVCAGEQLRNIKQHLLDFMRNT